MAHPWRGSRSSRNKVRDGQDNSGAHDRRQEVDHPRVRLGTGNVAKVGARGVQSDGASTPSEELGGGMEVGRRRFGQGCETSLVPGRAQTQGRARRQGLAAYRLGRGCDFYQQARPIAPRLVTATTGKAGSGRCVNRKVLRLARARLLVRCDQHEKSGVNQCLEDIGLVDDGVSTRHR
jgi:hypothetical protein